MRKHDEARIALNKFRNRYYNDIDGEKRDVAMALDVVLPYLVKTEKELEELKQDVQRYFELGRHYIYVNASQDNYDEVMRLHHKLSKVGGKE
ncbi:MAG: hypothetical protein EOM68_18490 [Spirochaetia bacterium]|nr:hypothetical protein [Spirochaetia bacterium]